MQDTIFQNIEIKKQLQEANSIKEKYIGYLFSTCSNYINKINAFRTSINRMLKTGKLEEALRKTQPTESNIENEIKELNHIFDSTFLSIYPDFIKDFNTLLKVEERYENNVKSLNTELRICALIWLGFNSTVQTANFLHISPQTIYNAKMKIKKKAIKDTDQIFPQIHTLGRD
jgi:conjugal transfer/entry exclusion protein